MERQSAEVGYAACMDYGNENLCCMRSMEDDCIAFVPGANLPCGLGLCSYLGRSRVDVELSQESMIVAFGSDGRDGRLVGLPWPRVFVPVWRNNERACCDFLGRCGRTPQSLIQGARVTTLYYFMLLVVPDRYMLHHGMNHSRVTANVLPIDHMSD